MTIKRLRIMLYTEIPQHREIMIRLDKYSGRALQHILGDALQIGLRHLLENPLPPVADSVPDKKPVKTAVKTPEQTPEQTAEKTAEQTAKQEEDELQAQRDGIRLALQRVMEPNQ